VKTCTLRWYDQHMMNRKQQFEASLLRLAKNMNIDVDELLLEAKQCREIDGIKTHIDGFDDIVNDILGVKNV